MRWILIIGGFVALLFAFKNCSGDLAKGATEAFVPSPIQDKQSTEQPKKSTSSIFDVSSRVPQSQPQIPPSFLKPARKEEPITSTVYFFKNRTFSPQFFEAYDSSLYDINTNSVSIYGPKNLVSTRLQIFKTLDKVPYTAYAKVMIIFEDLESDRGYDLSSVFRVAKETSASIVGDIAKLDISFDDLGVALELLKSDGHVFVEQEVILKFQSGEPTMIESVNEVAIPSTTVSNGVSNTSFEFRKIGLIVKATPTFMDAGTFDLKLDQESSLISEFIEVDDYELPVIDSQTFSTTVKSHIGDTYLLGGVKTFRTGSKKGIISNRKTKSKVRLYIILSTFADIPPPKITKDHIISEHDSI